MTDLKSFYQTNNEGKKIIDPKLFDNTANDIAASFYGKNEKGRSAGVSITQLRRLFDEVKRFEQILETSSKDTEEDTWNKQYPYIRMIKSKVNYTVARMIKTKQDAKKYYDNLSRFISQSIDLVKTREDYFVFSSLFEAVYGFYYENAPKE